jgi:DNA-binding MarR family transcriptional regulator
MHGAYHQYVASESAAQRHSGPPAPTERLANLAGAVSLAFVDLIRTAEQGLPAPADHPSCLAALNLLAWLPGITPAHLSDALRLTQPATQRVIDRLEHAGLATRHRRRGQRRLSLTCTEAGQQLIQQHRAARSAALREVLSTLTAEQAATLESLLERLAAHLAIEPGDVLRVCRLCRPAACGTDDDCPVWTGYLSRDRPHRPPTRPAH